MLSLAQSITQLLESPPAGSRVHASLTLPLAQAPVLEFPETLPAWCAAMLRTQGIGRLATYQGQALQHWQQGQHVCVSAPTGGGRGLVRLLALYHALAATQQGHALLLFPHKDRELAQLATITAWNAQLPPEHRLTAAIYDGDTPPTERRTVKQSPPHLLLTTPEMLHAGILAYHAGWRTFFQGLRAVVLADVQHCSGALGAHVTHLLQRLQRVSQHYGAQPQYLLTSAPVAHLQAEAQTLLGQPCALVAGAAVCSYQQHRIVLEVSGNMDPVIQDLGMRLQATDSVPLIIPGHSTLTPPATFSASQSVRSVIFQGMPQSLTRMHEHLALLASTQAHSLGILLLRGETPLERYLLRYPALYEAPWLQALGLYPQNPLVAQRHQLCAAVELASTASPPAIQSTGKPDTPPRQPHRGLQLRTYEPSCALVTQPGEKLLTILPPARAFRQCFAGAIYHHNGQGFHVEQVLAERRRILVRPVHATYLTRGIVQSSVTEQQVEAAVAKDTFCLATGALTYTETLQAYERLDARSGTRLSIQALAAHRRQSRTQGLWFDFPAFVAADSIAAHTAVHALVHATLASIPLFLADETLGLRGGVKTDATGKPGAVFIDVQAGGNGVSAFLYRTHERVLRASLQLLLNCDCTSACPHCIAMQPACDTCVHHVPLDRQAGITLLQRMLGEVVPALEQVRLPSTPLAEQPLSPGRVAPRHVYLRLTTQHSADEVGGWQHKHLLGLGVAVAYDTRDQQYRVYTAETVSDLLASLHTADLVIGFNLGDFDYQVLQPYSPTPLTTVPTLALLAEVQHRLGFRLSLSHLARETLGIERPDESLDTLDWFRQGDRSRVVEHCRRDLELLRALMHHGATTGSLMYRDLAGERHAMPVEWQSMEGMENPVS